MNIINSATPRQQSIPSVRCAGEAMFTPSPSSSIAPDYQSFIVTHGENATVLGPSRGVVVRALGVAAFAAAVGTRTQQHKSTKIADQNDAARAFKLCLRPLLRQEFSVELCPNGNRLLVPGTRFADTAICRSRKSRQQWPSRHVFCWVRPVTAPHEPLSGSTRLIPRGSRTKRLQQGRDIRLCIDTCICAARLGSGPLRR